MTPARAGFTDLGRMPYAEAHALQESLRTRILAGDTEAEQILFVEHPAVMTLGRRAKESDLLVSRSELAGRGIAVERSTRGGEITYHGPGQIVMYPVVTLRRGIVEHVEAMAGAIVEVARGLGIAAEFRRACPGVWVGDAKLAAFGVHVHRRVAIHGAALNVTPDLGAFDLIVPCGIAGCRVTSIAALAGDAPPRAVLVDALGRALARRLWPDRAELSACA
jgi:lipoyl(octanoyl) transferase